MFLSSAKQICPGRNENFQGGEKGKLGFQSCLQPCSRCEAPKGGNPLVKWAGIRALAGKWSRRLLHPQGEQIPTSLAVQSWDLWVLFSS